MAGAPPVQRLEHWTLVTDDLERSKRFYTDVLGAEEPERTTGPTSVNFAGTIIDLFPAGGDRQPSPAAAASTMPTSSGWKTTTPGWST
jgi:catechol 2,3-dioxygenase-like lactoylglutathione lyase family enzyme